MSVINSLATAVKITAKESLYRPGQGLHLFEFSSQTTPRMNQPYVTMETILLVFQA